MRRPAAAPVWHFVWHFIGRAAPFVQQAADPPVGGIILARGVPWWAMLRTASVPYPVPSLDVVRWAGGAQAVLVKVGCPSACGHWVECARAEARPVGAAGDPWCGWLPGLGLPRQGCAGGADPRHGPCTIYM